MEFEAAKHLIKTEAAAPALDTSADRDKCATCVPSCATHSFVEDAPLLETGVPRSHEVATAAGWTSKHVHRLSDCLDAPQSGWRLAIQAIALSSALGHCATGLVLANMVLMCMPYDSMPADDAAQLEMWSTVITWIFTVEMVVKVVGLGCTAYWADRWNVLDGSIVTLSIIEVIVVALLAGDGMNISFLRVLRMLRVLRVLRLMKSWRGMYRIVVTFIRAIPQMTNVMLLTIIVTFMFALLGMQLFGGIFNPETGYSLDFCMHDCADGLLPKPRYHFDSFAPAWVTIFILLTGEWVDAFTPAAAQLGPVVAAFYIGVVVVGKYLVLNLLIAVLVAEFAGDEDGMEDPRDNQPPAGSLESNGDGIGPDKQLLEVTDNGQVYPAWPSDYSLCIFSPVNPLRRLCRYLVSGMLFDGFITSLVIVSTACLALDSPRLDAESQLASFLKTADVYFTAAFLVEMLMKVVALGFACMPKAYLTSAWNQLDFAIVLISTLALLAENLPQLRPLKVLRVMRVLRPLRLVSRNAGMKLIITSLFKAMPGVSNVLACVLALQLIFAILGMQLYMGALASCSDAAAVTREDCNARGMQWANPSFGSFDDFGSAMRLLYIMSSGDDWDEPMFAMMGASKSGVAPVREDFSGGTVFAVSWMLIGYIFAINLFIGVVIDKFSRMQKEQDGSATMTPEQTQWAVTIKASMRAAATRTFSTPLEPMRKGIFDVVSSMAFDGFITAVIILNVVVMACDYEGIEEDASHLALYSGSMQVFVCIYYAECVMKMFAFGAGYFRDNWCRFDFFLVCTSLMDQFANELLAKFTPMPPTLLRVLRVIRILRILRLLKNAKQLRDLIVTMVLSFPSLLNVGGLLALITFMYSVLGLTLFTFVADSGEVSLEAGLTAERNFRSLASSALVLFQCLTADGWSSVMNDAMIDESSGLCSDELGTCGTIAAVPFFISFQICGTFIFVNLVVAVILENFRMMHNANSDLASVADLEAFAEAWAEFDPDATKYIHREQLVQLVLKLPPPLGIKGSFAREARARSLCYRLSLKQRLGRVSFQEVLKELIEKSYFFDNEQDESGFKQVAGEERSLPWGELPSPRLMQLQADSPAKSSWVMDKVTIGEVLAMQLIRSRLRTRLEEAKERLRAGAPTAARAPPPTVVAAAAAAAREPAPGDEKTLVEQPMPASTPREHEATRRAVSPARSPRPWSSRKKFGLFSSRQKRTSQMLHSPHGAHISCDKVSIIPAKTAQPAVPAVARHRPTQSRSATTPTRRRVRLRKSSDDGFREVFQITLACLFMSSCCALTLGGVLLIVLVY